MKGQLMNIQSSMKLYVFLLLGDDAKKGEMVLKSKCSPRNILPRRDEAGDGENKDENSFRSNKGGNLIVDASQFFHAQGDPGF